MVIKDNWLNKIMAYTHNETLSHQRKELHMSIMKSYDFIGMKWSLRYIAKWKKQGTEVCTPICNSIKKNKLLSNKFNKRNVKLINYKIDLNKLKEISCS